MIHFEKLSTKFKVRKLEDKDVPLILKVFKSNPLYFRYCPPSPSEETVKEGMFALPPNKSMQDKYYLGFFNDKELIAVMDVIEGYPSKETIFWGLFMMASDYAGKGLGSQIVQECLRAFKEQGFLAVRLAYRKENPQSKAFWEKCGFLPTGVQTHNGQGIVVVMEKSYKRKSATQSGIASKY